MLTDLEGFLVCVLPDVSSENAGRGKSLVTIDTLIWPLSAVHLWRKSDHESQVDTHVV